MGYRDMRSLDSVQGIGGDFPEEVTLMLRFKE